MYNLYNEIFLTFGGSCSTIILTIKASVHTQKGGLMNKSYTAELNKLMLGLMERNIEFEFKAFLNGGCVKVGSQDWDAICHDGSYGHTQGLLEVMGERVNRNPYDSVEGYLTAQEILDRLDEIERSE